jgi:hypothetical protein
VAPDLNRSDIPLREIDPAAVPSAALSPDRVSVAGHKVEYDEVRKLWYCDIDIDAGQSYYPFVRLALARFQPISVWDAHLSRVVLADFAQLAPDRAASIAFDDATTVRLTVTGPGYNATSASQEAQGQPVLLPGSGSPATISEATAVASAPVPAGNVVEVSVEEKSDTVPGEELGWIPVANAGIEPARGRNRDMLWAGRITLPSPRGSKRYRLVIREYETFLADPAGRQAGRRLVYADTLKI